MENTMKILKSRIKEIIKEEYQRLVEADTKELSGLTAKTARSKAEQINNKFSTEADELLMYLEKDGDLYRRQYEPIEKNLMKKAEKDKFDIKLAPKLWMYLVDNAAKKYIKEFGSSGDRIQDIFPKKLRMQVAEYLSYKWVSKYLNGEYN